MDGREVKLRNALARIFEPHNPETWEHCDIPGRDRIDEAIREIDRERALERGQVRELHALLLQALDYEREAWDEDEQIEGGDLVEFFGEWRRRAEAALTSLRGVADCFDPSDPPGTPLKPEEPVPVEEVVTPVCPQCGRIMSNREKAEQGACNDCHGGAC